MPRLDILKTLLIQTGVVAKNQDGGVLLYNKSIRHLSRGILVADLEAATKVLYRYRLYLQSSPSSSLLEFSAQNNSVAFTEVSNKVDDQSAYFINRTAKFSLIDKINLLKTAKELQERATISAGVRSVSKLSKTEMSRYLRLKKVARMHLEQSVAVESD